MTEGRREGSPGVPTPEAPLSRIAFRPTAPGLRALSLVVIGALVAGAPRQARAQAIRPLAGVNAVAADADHRLLSGLSGAAVRGHRPLGASRFSLRLGAEYLRGEQRRTGSPCTGLIEPWDPACAPRPLRDEARLGTAEAGLGFRGLGGARFAADLLGALRLGYVQVSTHYAPNGSGDGKLEADQWLLGFEWGAEVAWAPVGRVPLALMGGARLGILDAVSTEDIVDGYTPFEGGFDMRRAYLGLGWMGRAR